MDRQKKRGEMECILGIGWDFIVIGAPRLDENLCVGVGGLNSVTVSTFVGLPRASSLSTLINELLNKDIVVSTSNNSVDIAPQLMKTLSFLHAERFEKLQQGCEPQLSGELLGTPNFTREEWQELLLLTSGVDRRHMAYFERLTVRNMELKIGSFVELEAEENGEGSEEELGRVGHIDGFIECCYETKIVVAGDLKIKFEKIRIKRGRKPFCSSLQ